MSVNEKMVQDIVQEVVAKMQISSDVSGKKGVFSDMNEAIEASKKGTEDRCEDVYGPERGNHFQDQREDQRKCRNPCTYGC